MKVPKGLRQRSGYWWIDFRYRNKRYRKSTGVQIPSDKKDSLVMLRAAVTILNQMRAGVVLGVWTGTVKNATLNEAIKKYLAQFIDSYKSKNTILSIMSLLSSAFGKYGLNEITTDMINEQKNKWLSDGYSANTINRNIIYTRRIFKVASTQWEWTDRNPAARVEFVKGSRSRDRWLTDEEEVALLAGAPAWLSELIVFGINTGMRLSEILNLKWDDVDLRRGVVNVGESKTGEPRNVPMNDRAMASLHARSKVRSILTDLVFIRDGNKISSGTVQRGVRRAAVSAGITNFVFHDLRHTFATRLIQKGTDIYTVQRLLGHKSGRMTERYAHHSVDSLRGAVAAL